MTGRRLARFPAFRAGVAQDDDVGSTLSQGSTTGVLSGPNWSYWPSRVLGSADPTTIAHRHGTHRITSPDETWLALQPFLAPAGITGVADVTWLDCLGIPTVQAVRPASLTLSVSQGKAASYRAAQVSAVMESLEGTSATLEVTFGGFGLHHDPNVALSRAITEAAQSRITAISGAREDLPSAIYHRFGRVHTYAKARKTSLRLNRARPTPWRVPDVDSLPELVASAATAVANRSGTEPLAVVCDFADACVPVVKVLAPGLVLSSASPMRTPLQEAE